MSRELLLPRKISAYRHLVRPAHPAGVPVIDPLLSARIPKS
jgi:hypothetical protein